MGWLSGWSFRKTVTITGETGAGTDYQVNFSIGDGSGGDFTLPKCDVFPQDIQVTDNDQTTPLDYWVEDLTLDPISMWVKVDDDLGSNVDICFYYDKSGESSASNGRATFIAWDDFDGGSEQWTVVDGSGVQIEIDRVTNKRIDFTNVDDSEDNRYIYLDKGSDIGNFVFQATALRDSAAGFAGLPNIGASDTLSGLPLTNWNDGIIGSDFHDGTGIERTMLYLRYDGTNDITFDLTGYSDDTPYYYDLIRNGDDFEWNVYSDSARTNLLRQVTDTRAGISGLRYVYAYSVTHDSGTITGWTDDIRIRKYASPEPAFLSTGAEETPPTAFTSLASKLIAAGLI